MSDDASRLDGDDRRGRSNVADGGQPLLTRIFECLANQRRRYVLYYLHEVSHAQTDDIATQVAAWEQDTKINMVADDHCTRVQTELVHTHLPKLADYQFIDYDPRSGAVRMTELPTLLERVLLLGATVEKPD